MNDSFSCETKKEALTQFNKKDLYCLYCQTALLHNIHNTSHLLTVQHAIMFFLIIIITKMMTIYMYTTLLQVIFITCVQINSTDRKQLWSSSSRNLKTLIERNTVKTHHRNEVLFPLFCDKCNKLNKEEQWESSDVTLEMWRSTLDEAEISDATARLSMPVDCISHKKEESSSLHSSIHLSIHPSILPPRLQYMPVVCRNTLPSEIEEIPD